jgi:hypothetical protein
MLKIDEFELGIGLEHYGKMSHIFYLFIHLSWWGFFSGKKSLHQGCHTAYVTQVHLHIIGIMYYIKIHGFSCNYPQMHVLCIYEDGQNPSMLFTLH